MKSYQPHFRTQLVAAAFGESLHTIIPDKLRPFDTNKAGLYPHSVPICVGAMGKLLFLDNKINGNFSGIHGVALTSTRLFPDRNGIWKCWFLWREENQSTRRKTLGARTRTDNKFNPHMTPRPGIEPGPHWWEASALTTAPSLLPRLWDT